jgi:hypothetical protein
MLLRLTNGQRVEDTKMIQELNGFSKSIYMTKRVLNFLFLLLLLFVIGGAVLLYFKHRASMPQNLSREIPSYRYSKHLLEVGGFQFQGVYKGKKVLSIKADKFRIEKKK